MKFLSSVGEVINGMERMKKESCWSLKLQFALQTGFSLNPQYLHMTRQKVHQCQAEDCEAWSLNTVSDGLLWAAESHISRFLMEDRQRRNAALWNEFIESQRAAVFACGQMKVCFTLIKTSVYSAFKMDWDFQQKSSMIVFWPPLAEHIHLRKTQRGNTELSHILRQIRTCCKVEITRNNDHNIFHCCCFVFTLRLKLDSIGIMFPRMFFYYYLFTIM